MKFKQTKNEQLDNLYSGVILILPIIICLFLTLLKITIPFFVVFAPFLGLCQLPVIINQKKRLKKIKTIQQLLDIPISELQTAIGVKKYDLMALEKNKMFLSRRQIYQLEDYLDLKYIVKFGQYYTLN